MKKALSLILALVLCLSLCACGKSKEVKNVESLIASIGDISIDSGEIIAECHSAYDNLSDEDKASVSNYDVLLEAEKSYEKIAPVELKTGNINDYIDLVFEYKRGITEGVLYYGLESYEVCSELKVETNPLQNGRFENLNVKVKIELNNEDWTVDSDDIAYNKNDLKNLYVSFLLPANGEHSETHNIRGFAGILNGPPEEFKIGAVTYSFIEVSGTFFPEG